MPACKFCGEPFTTAANVQKHQSLAPACLKRVTEEFQEISRLRRERRANPSRPPFSACGNTDFGPTFEADSPDGELQLAAENISPQERDFHDERVDWDATAPTHTVELEGREENAYSRKKISQTAFPINDGLNPGYAYRLGKTVFQSIRDDNDGEVLGPFKDDAEWELAKWLIKNVGHAQVNTFLKLSIISERAQPSFHDKKRFLDYIDDLPEGVKWECEELEITGDEPDLEADISGHTMRKEMLEFWYRDPVQCVRELIGKPAFDGYLKYAPEQHFADDAGEVEVINEMWTASWWWKIQKQLPPGATIAPLIISSDKTKLSNFRGDASAWPVYLTIGNLPKEIRRSPSSHGTVLLGYLPIPKFDCFTKATRPLAKYRLFHDCMSILMESVVEAGKRGEDMVCADSWIRQIWPILAAYVADYPEQCLVACCMENRCPVCTVDPKERGNHVPQAPRTVQETLFFLRRMQSGDDDTAFKTLGLRAIYQPFWANLPHSNIFQSFTPDLLHQLHKGVFKDHLVKWCTEIIGKEKVDSLFRSMPSHPGLRHFKNGISHVSQWTGTEHKEMEKVFLGIQVVGGVSDERMIIAVRALMDFAYYASLQSHTTQTLAGMRKALDDFHANKDVFIELGGREQDHFNIPKVHSLEHYEELIHLFGSADGFNTESPERLHIDFAKNAYRASNRKDYIQQMTRWLQRQENVDRFSEFLVWSRTQTALAASWPSSLSLSNSHSPSHPEIEPLADDAVVIPEHAVSIPQAYFIAKHPPPSARHVTASTIISSDGYNASQFLEALSTFLLTQGSFYQPHLHDVFSLWKQVVFKLPLIPEVGARHFHNVIRAKPPNFPSGSGRRHSGESEPGHADFALIRTGEVNPATSASPLKGLRVGQVRAIFQLPSYFPIKTDIPLTYIEWFTPLRKPDSVTGYYHISRSTRTKRGITGPYAEIIPITRLVRNVMVIPCRDNDKDFFINSHVDSHSFCLFKLGLHDCLPS